MTDPISIYKTCGACKGLGIIVDDFGHEQVCGACHGEKTRLTQKAIDAAFFAEIMAELDYIHGKVTAIWEQVKPGS